MGRAKPHYKWQRRMTRQEKQALGLLFCAPIAIGTALLGAGSTKKTRRTTNRRSMSSYSNYSPSYSGSKSSSSRSSYFSYNVHIDFDGKEVHMEVKDNFTGRAITDETILNKIKRSPEYKRGVLEAMEAEKQIVDNRNRSFTEVCQRASAITPTKVLEKELNTLHPGVYKPKEYSISIPKEETARLSIITEAKSTFPEAQPTAEDIKIILQKEAKQKFSSFRFISRSLYVSKNVDTRLQNEIALWQSHLDAFIDDKLSNQLAALHASNVAKWEIAKAEFDETEKLKAEMLNAKYFEEFKAKQEKLVNRLNGEEDYVNSMIEKVLSEIDLPYEFTFEYVYDQENCMLCLDVDLPEIEDIPSKKAVYLSSGKVSVKAKTLTELRHDYAITVCGLAFFLASNMFEISPNIKFVRIAGYTQRINIKNDTKEDQYIYVVFFEREPYINFDFKSISPIAALQQFSHIINISSNGELKTISVDQKLTEGSLSYKEEQDELQE